MPRPRMTCCESSPRCVIIGGGFVGTFIFLYLVVHRVLEPDDLLIVDPYDVPLAEFRHRVGTCGMHFMRSTETHHLHPDPGHLVEFAKSADLSEPPFNSFSFGSSSLLRPSVELFFAHADHVIEQFAVMDRWLSARVTSLAHSSSSDELLLSTTNGDVTTEFAILALGPGENLCWPVWATELAAADGPVYHCLDTSCNISALPPSVRVAIVGAGLTGTQVACNLLRHKFESVILCGPDRGVHEFGVDPNFVAKEARAQLSQLKGAYQRASFIAKGIRSGGVTEDAIRGLERLAHDHTEFQRVPDHVCGATLRDDRVTLHTAERDVDVDLVLLATGWDARPMAHPFLQQICRAHQLETTLDASYPLLDGHLRWLNSSRPSRIMVPGLPAQLVLGPAARNFIGARFAAKAMMGPLNGRNPESAEFE